MSANRPPRYLRQRCKGKPDRAYTRADGKRVYLGRYGSEESRSKYAEILTSAGHSDLVPTPDSPDPTVNELLVKFLEWAKGHYQKSGEYPNYLGVARILREHVGDSLARDFGPKKLKLIRDEMIAKGWVRKSINKQTNRTRAIFAWAVSEEIIPATNLVALRAVRGLRAGGSKAKEKEPIGPVSCEDVDATLPELSSVVADMVRVHKLIGCRPSELLQMQPSQIDRGGSVWFYRPDHHKTEWMGKARTIAIGPRAQEVLKKYLFGKWCFQTDEGKAYRVDSYRRAITRACKRASVSPWTPGQLRHSTASIVRREFGLDSAQSVLGHSSANTTEIYAELDLSKAAEVALSIG